MSRWRFGLEVLRSLAGAVLLCAEVNAATVAYDIDGWSLGDGLPHEWVRCFQQTDDGYLWVGTRGGLARFDGKRIKAFTRANTPSAFRLNDCCLSLAKDRLDGSLWIGTREGVVNYKDGRFKLLNWQDERSNSDVWSLSASIDGGVWAGHGHGLARISSDHEIRHYDTPVFSRHGEAARGVASVIEDTKGRLFVANEDGIHQFNPTNLAWHWLTQASTGNHRLANNLIETRDGSIYWTTSTGLGRFVTNQVYFYPHPPEMVHPYGLAEDPEGAIWTGGHSGLHRFKDSKFSTFHADTFGPRESEPTGSGGVEGLMCDRQGNLWVGKRNGDGFFCVRPERFETYNKADGLLDEHPWVIKDTADNGLSVVSKSGVARWDGQRFHAAGTAAQIFTPAWATAIRLEDLPFGNVSPPKVNLLADGVDFWILREGYITRARGSNVTVWLSPAAYADESPASLRALLGARATSWKTNGIRAGRFIGLVRGADSAVWIGSWENGLYRIKDDAVANFDETSGLVGKTVGPLLCDEDGAIWLSNGPGLSRYKQGSFAHLGTSEGFDHGTITAMLDDGAGFYWFATQRAVVRVPKDALKHTADKLRARVILQRMGPPCFSGSFPAAARTSDGALWFPTLTGLLRFSPSQEKKALESFPCRIEFITIDGVSMDEAKIASLRRQPATLRLAPGQGQVVSIGFNQPHFNPAFKPAIRHRLLGQSKEWTLSEGEEAHYLNLPPGRYEFQAQAETARGDWLGSATFSFALAAPYYKTKLFYGATAGSLLLLLAGCHVARLRNSRRIYVLEQENAISKERERIAADMHDVLGSSLTKIGMQTELIKQKTDHAKPAEEDLQKLRQTVRDAVSELDEVIWLFQRSETSLRALIDHLQTYAEDFLEPSGLRLFVKNLAEIPDLVVPTEARGEIVLIVREALNNALKHAGGSTVWLTTDIKDNHLQIEIRDNGRGVEAGAEPKGNGNGFLNMRKRVESLHGRLLVDRHEATGTSITVCVPLQALGGGGA